MFQIELEYDSNECEIELIVLLCILIPLGKFNLDVVQVFMENIQNQEEQDVNDESTSLTRMLCVLLITASLIAVDPSSQILDEYIAKLNESNFPIRQMDYDLIESALIKLRDADEKFIEYLIFIVLQKKC